MINVDIDFENGVIYFDPTTPMCDLIGLRDALDLDQIWSFEMREEGFIEENYRATFT